MANKTGKGETSDCTTHLLRDLIIVQLGLAGVGQRKIRTIVGGDINRINRIVKLLRNRSNDSNKPRR